MHTSLTGSALILGAPSLRGTLLLTFDFAWFVAVWSSSLSSFAGRAHQQA